MERANIHSVNGERRQSAAASDASQACALAQIQAKAFCKHIFIYELPASKLRPLYLFFYLVVAAGLGSRGKRKRRESSLIAISGGAGPCDHCSRCFLG